MLANVAGAVINTDHVVNVVSVAPGPRGCPRCTVRMTDGSTQVLNIAADELAFLSGTVIPAPFGYQLARALTPAASEAEWAVALDFEPVLAFRITSDSEGGVFPITPDGPIGYRETAWAIVEPGGRCYRPGLERWDDVEAFLRSASADESAARAKRTRSTA